MYVYQQSKQGNKWRPKNWTLNEYPKGVNNWPSSVNKVVQLLNTYHIKKQPWGVQMMQIEMAFALEICGSQAKENGSRGRGINFNIIYHRYRETRHIAWICTNNIDVNYTQDEEKTEKMRIW